MGVEVGGEVGGGVGGVGGGVGVEVTIPFFPEGVPSCCLSRALELQQQRMRDAAPVDGAAPDQRVVCGRRLLHLGQPAQACKGYFFPKRLFSPLCKKVLCAVMNECKKRLYAFINEECKSFLCFLSSIVQQGLVCCHE